MPTYRTPDVYIEEIAVFPPSVAEVETAIPAFVGYTEKDKDSNDRPLKNKPVKLYSFAEFEQVFGAAKAETIEATLTGKAPDYRVELSKVVPQYLLHASVKLFFANGGGKCYVASAGAYAEPSAVTTEALSQALASVATEDEPTLLVVPEAVRLDLVGYGSICQEMLNQCGALKDRFAILDVRDDPIENLNSVGEARDNFGGNLKYGAAYYPYLRTSLTHYADTTKVQVNLPVDGAVPPVFAPPVTLASLEQSNTGAYSAVQSALQRNCLTLPPSGAIAGVFAAVDTARGVWKAPANVSLSSVIEPAVKVSNEKHGELNVDPLKGKSINVIRGVTGAGTIVLGARTLAGNDNEWRYVSVRRFFNMVEESVKKSTYWAVFEPNDANTWVKVRGMIENYLNQKWREGALAGAAPKDAYFVRCGLGTTMNSQDILEGRLYVEIGMAVVRPAEFVILKFSHKLQTS